MGGERGGGSPPGVEDADEGLHPGLAVCQVAG